VDRGEHHVPRRIGHFVEVEMPVLPRIGPGAEEHSDFLTSIHPFLDPSRHARHVPFDRRVEKTLSGVWITTAGRQEALAD
jgi:hypothetical protein